MIQKCVENSVMNMEKMKNYVTSKSQILDGKCFFKWLSTLFIQVLIKQTIHIDRGDIHSYFKLNMNDY